MKDNTFNKLDIHFFNEQMIFDFLKISILQDFILNE